MRMRGQDTGRNFSGFDRAGAAARNKIWDAATILPPTTASTIVLWFRTKMFTASESTGVPEISSNYCQTRYIALMKTLFRFDEYPIVGRTQYMLMTDIFMFWRACLGGLYVLFTLRSSVLITSIDQTLKKKWSDKVFILGPLLVACNRNFVSIGWSTTSDQITSKRPRVKF